MRRNEKKKELNYKCLYGQVEFLTASKINVQCEGGGNN